MKNSATLMSVSDDVIGQSQHSFLHQHQVMINSPHPPPEVAGAAAADEAGLVVAALPPPPDEDEFDFETTV